MGKEAPLRDRVSTENVVILEPMTQHKPRTAYLPPIAVVLRGLGITELDLRQDKVTVSTQFLRFVVGYLVSRGEFDPSWYAEKYPDVEAARMAGLVNSLQDHYCTQGYFEGRMPCELPFDPEWYHGRYQDVAQAFSPDDVEGLHQHFRNQGWREGRVGVAEVRKEADRWMEAARKTG